jgi:hypothetical protein
MGGKAQRHSLAPRWLLIETSQVPSISMDMSAPSLAELETSLLIMPGLWKFRRSSWSAVAGDSHDSLVLVHAFLLHLKVILLVHIRFHRSPG